jgi:hypothetical protein
MTLAAAISALLPESMREAGATLKSSLAESDLASFPDARALRNGRSVEDGYARGWGLQYGGLDQKVAADPVYLKAAELAQARSVISLANRMNLYLLLRFYLAKLRHNDGHGDIIEFGSFRGGNAIFMAAAAKLLGLDCHVYALDTFAGMPPTDHAVDAHRAGDFAQTDLDELEGYVRSIGLDNLTFVKGLFEDTAPGVLAKSRPIALAHIDCDIHSAVKYSYEIVKPHMVPMGYIVFDDACFSSCIGATEVVEDQVIRQDGLNSEQIYPQFVFRASA